MKKTTVRVKIPHPFFGNKNGLVELAEVSAYPSKTPGLVVLEGMPCFNYDGRVQFTGQGAVIMQIEGGMITHEYTFHTQKDMLKIANALRACGLDWKVNFQSLQPEALDRYRTALMQALRTAWL